MDMKHTNIVCLGDSIATNYKLKVRSNTFTDLLGRRFGLEPCNFSVPGATTGFLLGFLKDNDEIIEAVKNAEMILISCGTNNVLQTGLEIMGEAVGYDITSWRLLPKIVETIRTNPVTAVKMVTALNRKESKSRIMEGVKAYKEDLPRLVDRIRELNSDAVVAALTVFTLADVTKNPAFKITTKALTDVVDDLNGWMKDFFPAHDVLIADLEHALREYSGKEELSNQKQNDVHLSDEGHIFTYRLIYDTITERYPEYRCEEGLDVIQVRKRKKHDKEVIADATDTDEDDRIRREVRELIEESISRDIPDYDENKQFMEMGIAAMEVFDITRNLEKKFYGGKETVELPSYDLSICVRPVFFVEMLKGNRLESILDHMDLLERYESPEEKKAAEKNDSPAMKVLKKEIYDYLQDDMVKLDKDTTYFGTLHMNYVDWYNVLRPAEVDLNMRLDPARTPSPETAALGEIAAFAER